MKTNLTATMITLLVGFALLAQQAPAQNAAKTPAVKKSFAPATPARNTGLTAMSVKKMLAAKLSEPLIEQQIRDNGKPIKMTADELVDLKTAGASDNLLMLMQNPSQPKLVASAAPPPAAAPAVAPEPAAVPIVAASVPTPQPALFQGKKRVAVDEFEYSTVKTAVQQIFGTEQNIGKGIRAMLTTRVAKDNQLTIVERVKIDKLMGEQDFGVSGRVKAGANARASRIHGAEAFLLGDIVVFGRDDRKAKVTGGGAILGRIGGGLTTWKHEDKAVVSITYRLVDTETSEVIATGEARGESVRKGKGWGALLGVFAKVGAGIQVDMTSENFAQTIIGEATQDCVNKLAAILNESAPKLVARKLDVKARVAEVSGNVVTINAGSNDGLQVGHQLSVESNLGEVRDPVTKEVLDVRTQAIGVLVITTVHDRMAIGTYTGPGTPKANDVARTL